MHDLKNCWLDIILILIVALMMSACSKSDTSSATPPALSNNVVVKTCVVYDSCTYTHSGWSKLPVYDCVPQTLQMTEHPEIAAEYFQGSSCLTTYEDYQDNGSSLVQGPGPLAIPGIGI